MTATKLCEALNLKVLVEVQADADVSGCYCGDLLSWVMGKAKTGDCWLTVMGNINAIAVAVLTECACIILTENAPLDEPARLRAIEQGVPIFQTELSSYKIATEISKLI